MEVKNFADEFISEMRETDVSDRLSESECLVPYAGAKMTLIKLLFIKAMMAPDNIDVKDVEDMRTLGLFTRMVFFAYGDYKEDVLKKALNVLKKNYDIQQDIIDVDLFQNIMQHGWYIMNQNFAKSSGEVYSADDYALSLADLISRPQSSKDTENSYQYYTNQSLQQMVAKILNVKKTETFMDCCCGMFSSALYNDAANYIGVELDKEMAGIAAMIMIMCKKKFDLKKENFVESKYENIADKIFTDVSYGVEMPKMENRPYGKNGEAYCIENAVKALKDGGTAVVACSGSVLVKQDSSKKMREAITRDHLKAVIALPPMNNGTKSNTNLIVLEKNCHAKEIKFINASNLEIENEKRMTLNESDISDVIKCIDGEKSNCLSKNIKVEDVLNSGAISWAPNYYVDGGKNAEVRPVEVIDKELKASYKELKKLMSE